MNIAVPAEQSELPIRSIATVTLVALLSVGLIAWHHRRAQTELLAIPVQERTSLYERTLSTLQTTCSHAEGAELTAYCQTQALFVSRFPECDATCQSICNRYLPRATR